MFSKLLCLLTFKKKERTYFCEDRTFCFLYIYSIIKIKNEIGHLQRPRKNHFLSSSLSKGLHFKLTLFYSLDSEVKRNLLTWDANEKANAFLFAFLFPSFLCLSTSLLFVGLISFLKSIFVWSWNSCLSKHSRNVSQAPHMVSFLQPVK